MWAFCAPSCDSAHLMTEVLFEENFVVHLCRSNPLAKRRALKIKDLAGETLLMPKRDGSTYLYDKTFELYAEAGVTPNVLHVPLHPVPHSDTQIVLLTCHKGIFIMPDEVACRPAQGSEVVALPLDEPNAKIDVHIAWRKAEKLATVLAFVDTSRRVFPDLSKRNCPSDRGKPPVLSLAPQLEPRS